MSGRYQNKGKPNYKSQQGEKTGANADKWVKNVQNQQSPDKYSSDSQGGNQKRSFLKEKSKNSSTNNPFHDSERTKLFDSSSTSKKLTNQNSAPISSQNHTIHSSSAEVSGENNSNKNRSQIKQSQQFKRNIVYKEISPLEFTDKAENIREIQQNTTDLQFHEMNLQEKSLLVPNKSMTSSPVSQKSSPNVLINSQPLVFVEKDTFKQRNVVATSSSLDPYESPEAAIPCQQNALPSINQQYNIEKSVDNSTTIMHTDNPNANIPQEKNITPHHQQRYSPSKNIENDHSQDSGHYYQNEKRNLNSSTDNPSSKSQSINQLNAQDSNSTFNNTGQNNQNSGNTAVQDSSSNSNGINLSGIPSGSNFQIYQSKRSQNQAKEPLIYQEKIEGTASEKAVPLINVSEHKNQKQMRQAVEKKILQTQESNRLNTGTASQVDQVHSSSSSENTINVSKSQRTALPLKMDQKQRESFIQFEIKMPLRAISLYIDEMNFKEDKIDLVLTQQLRSGNFDNFTEIEIKMKLVDEILKNIFDRSIKLDEVSFSESVQVQKLQDLIRHYNEIRFPSPRTSNQSSLSSAAVITSSSQLQLSSQTGISQQQQMQGQIQIPQMQIANGMNTPIIQNPGIPHQFNNAMSNQSQYIYPNNNFYPQSQQNYQNMINPYYQQQYFGNQQQYPQGQKHLRNQYAGTSSYSQPSKKSTQGSYKTSNIYSNIDEEKN